MEEQMGGKIEKIEKIEKLDPKAKTEAVVQGQEAIDEPSKTKFDAAITKAELNWQANQPQAAVPATDAVKRTSLIEELQLSEQKIQRLQPASIEQITAQAEDLRGAIKPSIEKLETTLQENPQAKLSPVYEAQLSQRLVHIDSSLRSAVGSVGAEVGAKPAAAPSTNPLVKFMSYLTTSDRKLQNLLGEVKALDVTNKRLTPEKLLAIQIKLGFVQQELEFFTNVLNKALEAVKTTMNVQI